MKIDKDFDSPMLQMQPSELSQRSYNANGRGENSNEDKITISNEAREALTESMDDIIAMPELIETISESYPEKDLKLKIDDIEIEATEPDRSSKLGSLIGGFLSRIIS